MYLAFSALARRETEETFFSHKLAQLFSSPETAQITPLAVPGPI
jgi:hypothetical protein